MKAFLSHSSKDKGFVRAVAKKLGRQFSVFDEAAFNTGTEFRESILTGLQSSTLFVLFLSAHSVNSNWVKFEVEESWHARLQGSMKTILVYSLDSSIDHTSLPHWLQRAKVSQALSPTAVAREIRDRLGQIMQSHQQTIFVGRSPELAELESILTPIEKAPPRTFLLSGLPGIGRRSVLRRLVPQLFDIDRLATFDIGEGDSDYDIALKVAELVEPHSSPQGLKRIAAEISSLPRQDAILRTKNNLEKLTDSGDFPVISDAGGIVDDSGQITTAVGRIIRAVDSSESAYLGIISKRKPQNSKEYSLPTFSIKHLSTVDMARLLQRLSQARKLQLNGPQIRKLALFAAGYPPAAYFISEQIKSYGVDAVLSDAGTLTQFRTSKFLQLFAEQQLTDTQRQILQLLSVYSPLPFSVLASIVEQKQDATADGLIKLIDLNLVVTNERHEYLIASPIAESALRTFGFPTPDSSRHVAESINHFISSSDLKNSILDLSRAMFRAALVGKSPKLAEEATHLANDLIKLTENLYHARRYEEVVDTSRTALLQRPDSTSTRGYMIRALAHLERYKEALEELDEFRGFGLPRESSFLNGFILRKSGRFQAAIDSFKRSLSQGRRGIAVHRELGMCYQMLGDLDSASSHIKAGLKSNPDNPYLLDLSVQIAIGRSDEATARDALRKLRLVEQETRYHHRASRLELAFGNKNTALNHAEKAAELESDPRFEVLAQLALCYLLTDSLALAESVVDRIEANYPRIRLDVRLGLRSRVAMRSGNIREAYILTGRFTSKLEPVNMATRLKALELIKSSNLLRDEEYESVEAEIVTLTRKLKNTPKAALFSI